MSKNKVASENKTIPFSKSNIYLGNIIHRRFSPTKHSFNYRLYMLALDVGDIEDKKTSKGVFGFCWYHPLRFVEKDYLRDEPFSLSERIKKKVSQLNGHNDINSITMLIQVRCFGIYFSPANFYFCYDKDNNCTQMLAEVSNTPWNERHYYLIDLLDKTSEHTSKKVFQVSPFMDLDMTYFWQIKPPTTTDNKLLVKIENKKIDEVNQNSKTLFDVSLVMKKLPFSTPVLMRIWCQLPIMTIKIVFSIYWQAVKIFLKRIPFIGYQKIN